MRISVNRKVIDMLLLNQLLDFAQRKKIIVIILLILVVGMSICIIIFNHFHHQYDPVVNPNPTQFITISGKIDPRISGLITATYQNSNRKAKAL